MEVLELKLEDGMSVFAEVKPSRRPGEGRMEAVSNRKLEAQFSAVSGSLAAIAQSVETQLAKLVRRPDKVALEMGAELRGAADLWLVSGEAKGHMKITLTWDKPAEKAPAGPAQP